MVNLSVEAIEFVTIGICLVISAFFSGAETAITSLGTLKARHIINNGGKAVRSLTLWLDHPGRVLTTILIFNNIVNILASSLATDLAQKFFESQAIGIAVGSITLLVLIFGEIIPKSFAKAHAEAFGLIAIRIIHVIYLISFPAVWVFSEFARNVIKMLGSKKEADVPPVTEDELQFLVNVGERAGVLEQFKKDMIVGVFEFDETKVREIMTPRTDVLAIPVDDTVRDATQQTIESGHSRIPVYDEKGIDHVVGIILAKDLLRANANGGQDKKVSEIMREPFFEPESKMIMDVFKDLKRTKNHMAIVIDEYGGTAGLVTLEDILEEIVGEIQDEYDTEEANILEIENGIYDVAGNMNIDDFLEFFELDEEEFAEERETDIDTISGWVTQMAGSLPETGKVVKLGPLNLEITEIDRHRIVRLRVAKIISHGEEETVNT